MILRLIAKYVAEKHKKARAAAATTIDGIRSVSADAAKSQISLILSFRSFYHLSLFHLLEYKRGIIPMGCFSRFVSSVKVYL